MMNLAGLMALIAAGIIGTSRFVSKVEAQSVLFGCILGSGAAIISAQPLMHINDLQIDPRNLFVGCAAAIFGPLAGLVTFIIAAITRYQEDIPFSYVCIFSLFLSGCMGLVWKIYFDGQEKNHKRFATLGLFISTSYISTFLLPKEYWSSVFYEAIPLLVLVNMLGSLVLGGFLSWSQKQNEFQEQLMRQASYDPLTRLLNRRAFEDKYKSMLELSNDDNFAYIMMDLDCFKEINDRYGHPVGDDILIELSRAIMEYVGGNNIAARFGGDEFVIFLQGMDSSDVFLLLSKIKMRITNIQHEKIKSVNAVTVSFGAFCSKRPLPLSMAINCADSVLNLAKTTGKNQIVIRNHGVALDTSLNWRWGEPDTNSHA